MSIHNLIVKGIVSVYTVDLKRMTYSNPCRPYSAFCIKLSGRSIYTQEGRKYCSDCSHLVLLPKGASYSYIIEELGKCIVIDLITENEPSTIQSYSVADSNVLKNIASSIQYAWNDKRAGYRELCLSNVYQLMYQAILHEKSSYISSVHQAKLEKSMLYLSDHFHEHSINMEDIAKQSNISVIYFRKLFHEITGISPKKYITLMRINYAKELLAIKEYSIELIADIVGFGDVYSFSKTFHKEVGCTPSEYRRNWEKELTSRT